MFWALGYYAAGVRGVGPPGIMFVLSAEEWYGATWYVSALSTLADPRVCASRGPLHAYALHAGRSTMGDRGAFFFNTDVR